MIRNNKKEGWKRRAENISSTNKAFLVLSLVLAFFVIFSLSYGYLNDSDFGNYETNLITGAAIGIQDPMVVEEPVIEEPVIEDVVEDVIEEQDSGIIIGEQGLGLAAVDTCNSCADCQTKAVDGVTLQLLNNITNLAADCINLAAGNLVIDCQGYSIISENSFRGIDVNFGNTNVTVNNCSIYNAGTGVYGDAHNVTVDNSSFYHNSVGIDMRRTDHNVRNNYFYNNTEGITFSAAHNAIIRNNKIVGLLNDEGIIGSSGNDIVIDGNDLYNHTNGILISSTSSKTNYDIINNYIYNSTNDGISLTEVEPNLYFANNTINLSLSDCLVYNGDNNNDNQTFLSNTFVNCTTSSLDIQFSSDCTDNYYINNSIDPTVQLRYDQNCPVYFINNSFNKSWVDVVGTTGRTNAKFFVQWYLDVHVQDTAAAAIANANVSVFNVTGDLFNISQSDANGNAPRLVVTEFYQNNTNVKFYETPHNITANLTDYIINYTSVNFTNNESTILTIVLPSGATSCGDTITADTTLTAALNGCTGDGITIGASDIILDCANFQIDGDGDGPDSGVLNSGIYSNITVKNCVIKNFGTAIAFSHSHNVTIWNNTLGHVNFSTDTGGGINFANCTQANISNNIITNITADATANPFGITFAEFVGDAPAALTVSSSVIFGNNISRIYGEDNVNPFGINLGDANFLKIDGLKVDGNVIENINCTSAGGGTSCESNGGIGIRISSGTNVNITNNNVSYTGTAILPNQPNLRIVNNYFRSSTYGIGAFQDSASIRFNHSWIENNTFDGLTQGVYLLGNNHNNTFLNNNFSNILQFSILDFTVGITNNSVIYNSSMGEIKWDKSNITTNITLGVNSSDLYIENGTIGLINDINTFKLNDTAQITFSGLAYPVTPQLLKDNVRCDDGNTCNITYDTSNGVLVANISSFSNYTLQEGTPPYFDPTPTNQTVQYISEFNYDVNGTDDTAIGNYSVNDTAQFRINASGMISNATHLHYGFYGLNISINDTFNNVNSTIIFINVTDTTVPYFDPTPTNQTVQYSSNFFYDINGSDNYNISSYTVNDTIQFKINSSGGLTNVSTLHYGVIPINISVNDTFNNTNSTVIFINITDTTAPSFSPTPSDQSVQVDNQFLYDVNATDNYNVSSYTVNDTTQFSINISGTILNNTILAVGAYNLNISVNDTFNNTKSSAIVVTITAIPATPPADSGGSSRGSDATDSAPATPPEPPAPPSPAAPAPIDSEKEVLSEREVRAIADHIITDIRVPRSEMAATNPEAATDFREGPTADRGEVQRNPISDVEKVLVRIYNPGDKDLVVSPRIKKKIYELKDGERVEDILRDRLLDEFKDINEDDLRQKIEERKEIISLIERENVDFISVGKTASFFAGEVGMYSGEHTAGEYLRNSLITKEIVVRPKETVETELFLRKGLSLDPKDVEIILESRGVLLEEKTIAPIDERLIGTEIDFGEDDNIMDVYVLIPKEVSETQSRGKYHVEIDINQIAWKQRDLENIIVPRQVSSFVEFYGPYDVLSDRGAFLAQEIVYKFDPRSDYVIKSRIYKDGTLVSEHEFERLAIEKVAKDEFYDSPALVGRAFGTAVKLVPFGYRSYWFGLFVLIILIMITIYAGYRLRKIYGFKIKRKGVFDDLEEAKTELIKKIKVVPTFKRGKIASLIIFKRRLIKAALIVSYGLAYPFVILYRGFRFVKNLIVQRFRKLFRHSAKMSEKVSDDYVEAIRDNNRFVRKEVRRSKRSLFKFVLAIISSFGLVMKWVEHQFGKLFRRSAKMSAKVSEQSSEAVHDSNRFVRKEVRRTERKLLKFLLAIGLSLRAAKNWIKRQFRKLFRRSAKMSAKVSEQSSEAVHDSNRFVRKEVRRTEKKLLKFLLAIGLSLRAAKNWIKRQFRKLFRRSAKMSAKVSGGISETSSAVVKRSKNAKEDVSEASSMVLKESKRSLWKFIKNLITGTLSVSKSAFKFLTKWTIYTLKALVVGLAVIIKDTYLLIRKATIWSGKYLFLLLKSVSVGIWIALTSIVRFILFLVSFTLRNTRKFMVWSRSMISIGSSNFKTYLWNHKSCPHVKIKGTGIPAIVVSPLKKKPIAEWKQRRKLRLMEEMEQVDLRIKDIDKVSFKKMLKKPVTVVSKKKKILFIEKLAIKTKTKPTIVEKPKTDVLLGKELKWIDRSLTNLDKKKVTRTTRGIKKSIIEERVVDNIADKKAIEEVVKISKELEEKHQLARKNESKLQKELEKLNQKISSIDRPVKKSTRKVNVKNIGSIFKSKRRDIIAEQNAVQEVIKVSKELEERHQLARKNGSKLQKELEKLDMKLYKLNHPVKNEKKRKVLNIPRKLSVNNTTVLAGRKAVREVNKISKELEKKHLLEEMRSSKLNKELKKVEKIISKLR